MTKNTIIRFALVVPRRLRRTLGKLEHPSCHGDIIISLSYSGRLKAISEYKDNDYNAHTIFEERRIPDIADIHDRRFHSKGWTTYR